MVQLSPTVTQTSNYERVCRLISIKFAKILKDIWGEVNIHMRFNKSKQHKQSSGAENSYRYRGGFALIVHVFIDFFIVLTLFV